SSFPTPSPPPQEMPTVPLSSALPRSGHLNVRTPEPDGLPWKQLVIHNGRGGGLKRMRETLKGIATELKRLVDA
ncbi:MAG: hypothetical protein VXW22_14205, partial [Pseudomonadota bacterium]|nr:hypothetical protein [Pseudomonadota bacterium]